MAQISNHFNHPTWGHGTYTIKVTQVKPGDEDYQYGIPIRELRKELGDKDEGHMDFQGAKYFVSLKHWAKEDPDKTKVTVAYYFMPDNPPAPSKSTG